MNCANSFVRTLASAFGKLKTTRQHFAYAEWEIGHPYSRRTWRRQHGLNRSPKHWNKFTNRTVTCNATRPMALACLAVYLLFWLFIIFKMEQQLTGSECKWLLYLDFCAKRARAIQQYFIFMFAAHFLLLDKSVCLRWAVLLEKGYISYFNPFFCDDCIDNEMRKAKFNVCFY